MEVFTASHDTGKTSRIERVASARGGLRSRRAPACRASWQCCPVQSVLSMQYAAVASTDKKAKAERQDFGWAPQPERHNADRGSQCGGLAHHATILCSLKDLGGALLAGCGAPERDGTRPNVAIQFKKFMSRVESGLTRGVVKRKTDAEATSLNSSMQPGSFLSEPHAGYKSEPGESTQGLIEER